MKLSAKLITLCAGLAIVGLMLTGTSEAVIDSDSIVGIWLLNDNVKDSSGAGHNGEILGNANWGTGKFGGGMDFDGDTHVEVPDDEALRLSVEQTITIWANPSEGIGDWCRLVGKGGNADADLRNYGLWREAAGYFLYQIFDGAEWGNSWDNADAATLIPLGEWTHLAGVYDGATMKIYLNGAEVLSVDWANEPAQPEDPLTIGYSGYIHAKFKGTLDEVGVFNKPLSADDIVAIMDNGLVGATGVTAVSSEGKLAVTWGNIKK